MRNLRIKTKLYLIILIILIPLILAQSYSAMSHFNSIINFELEANHDFAEAIGLIFGNYVKSMGDELYTIGRTIMANPSLTMEEINAYLIQENMYHPTIRNFKWISSEGTVLASSWDQAAGISVIDRDYYTRILAGEDTIVSELVFSKINQEPTFLIARAIMEENQLFGFIVATVTVEKLNYIMPDKRVGESTSFGLIDNKGVFVYRNGNPYIAYNKIEATTGGPARKALDQGEPVKSKKYVSTINNKAYMGVDLPIPEVGWIAWANTEYQEVVAKAVSGIKYTMIVMISATLLSLLIAYKMFTSIITHVNKLQLFAQQMANGNLDVRTNIIGNDELAATGKALDRMASRIKELETSRRLFIQTSAHELRNPMTGIKGIVSLIRRRIAKGEPIGDAVNMLEIAEKEVDRLSMILNQILEAFKVQNEQFVGLTYNWEIINLPDLLNRAVVSSRIGMSKNNIVLNLTWHSQYHKGFYVSHAEIRR